MVVRDYDSPVGLEGSPNTRCREQIQRSPTSRIAEPNIAKGAGLPESALPTHFGSSGRQRRLEVSAGSRSGCKCQADGATRSTFQRPVHCPRITNEVRASHRIAREELVRQHVALHPVTGCARAHQVARRVGPTPRDRIHVVQGRFNRLEVMTAVHAPSPAIPHRGTFERAPVIPGEPGRVGYWPTTVPRAPL